MPLHTMTSRPVRRSAAAGLAVLLMSGAAGFAAQLSVGPHFQEGSSLTTTSPPTVTSCVNTLFCSIMFSKVPIGKQLVVRQLSCHLAIPDATAQPVAMYIQARRTTGIPPERRHYLIPTQTPSNQPGGYNVVINSNTYQLFDQRDRPEVFLLLDKQVANIPGSCSIAGEMSALP